MQAENINSLKLLGLHIKYVCSTVAKLLSALRRQKHILPYKTRILFQNAYIALPYGVMVKSFSWWDVQTSENCCPAYFGQQQMSDNLSNVLNSEVENHVWNYSIPNRRYCVQISEWLLPGISEKSLTYQRKSKTIKNKFLCSNRYPIPTLWNV